MLQLEDLCEVSGYVHNAAFFFDAVAEDDENYQNLLGGHSPEDINGNRFGGRLDGSVSS
jgi:hypothetical protein